mgnify:CR=1 FL=1
MAAIGERREKRNVCVLPHTKKKRKTIAEAKNGEEKEKEK